MCDLLGNSIRRTIHGLIIPHTCAYYIVNFFGVKSYMSSLA
jgi:hypothetical protein